MQRPCRRRNQCKWPAFQCSTRKSSRSNAPGREISRLRQVTCTPPAPNKTLPGHSTTLTKKPPEVYPGGTTNLLLTIIRTASQQTFTLLAFASVTSHSKPPCRRRKPDHRLKPKVNFFLGLTKVSSLTSFLIESFVVGPSKRAPFPDAFSS